MDFRKHSEFTLLVAFSLVFWRETLTQTFRLAWSNDAYTHILLIVPLSVALIYFNSKTVPLAVEPKRVGGLFFFALATVLGCLGRWGNFLASDEKLALSMFALVSGWMAGVICCYGIRVFGAFLFPICFLLWLVPWPGLLLNWIVELLQTGSAVSARLLFQLARVPVTQNGIALSIPGLDLEVARECSSIRSSLILIITTMILAHLFLRSKGRRLVLIIVAIPLSVVKNGLRIFVISELTTRVDPSYISGNFHRHGGIVFLLVALVVITGAAWLLGRNEPIHDSPPPLSRF